MMVLIATAFLIAAVTAPFAVVGLLFARQRRFGAVLLFLGLLVLDIILTGLPITLGLHPPGLAWNWFGKVLSIAWALAFVVLAPLRPRDVGLTVQQRPGSVPPALAVTLAAIAFTAFMVGGVQQANLETLLFQATMPGLAEELVFRGVLFALLVRAFAPDGDRSPRALVYATLVTALAFGLWHGLGIVEGTIAFNFMAFLFPFLGGLVFGWLRAFTGSLLFPVVAHNGANFILYVIP